MFAVKFKDGETWKTATLAGAQGYADKNPGAVALKGKSAENAYKAYTRRRARLLGIKPGYTVYCVLEHVSASGMTRRIKFLVPSIERRNGEGVHVIRNVSPLIADLTGYRLKEGALVVQGCGMDMGFAVVYDFGRALWPDGTPKPHGTRNGEPDSDGGYALKHQWL